jgi:hypothetical protein
MGWCGRSRGCAVILLWSGLAAAEPNDFQLYTLGCPSDSTCSALGVTHAQATANNDAFRVFVNEFAAALTSSNLMPPSSLGHAGFALNLELPVIYLTPNSTFVMPTTSPFSGPLLIPSVHVRKGLPWSFEAGARVGWINTSSMAVATIEGKWSINEGFAYLPDIGIRGYGTRLFNNRDMDLTSAGLDLGVGKRFAVGGMITLTPYAGWNLVWTEATSNNIDFQPGRSITDSEATPAAQLSNTGVYDEVHLDFHNRFYGGVRFIGGVLQLVGEISYSNLGSFTDRDGNKVSMPPVLAINTSIGLDF